MSLVDTIAQLNAREDIDEDERRRQFYSLKTAALQRVILPLVGQTIDHGEYTFRINHVDVTPEIQLYLDVTFTKPPAEPVTHQIYFTNPPVLPRKPKGEEEQDLLTTVGEMLEGFV